MSVAVPLFPLYAFMVHEGVNLPFLIIINIIVTVVHATAAAAAAVVAAAIVVAATAAAVLVLCIAASNPEKCIIPRGSQNLLTLLKQLGDGSVCPFDIKDDDCILFCPGSWM
jgi:hypothetical protein